MPELRPRWLEIAEEASEADAGEPSTEESLAEAEGLLALTEYPQWGLFHEYLDSLREEAVVRILDPSVQSMTVVAAYRARARVLEWLMEMPERERTKRDNLLESREAAEEDEDAE